MLRNIYFDLVGASINEILMSDEFLTFQTDKGSISCQAVGECCSVSYFYDFYGVKNLLENGPVVSFEEIDLSPGDPGYLPGGYDSTVGYDSTGFGYFQVYGYRLTTVHPKFGEVSSVFSFRNVSNGYYGGWINPIDLDVTKAEQIKLTDDKVGS